MCFLTAKCKKKRCDLNLAATQTTCSPSRQLNKKVSLLISNRRALTSAESQVFSAPCDWGTVVPVWVHRFLATEMVLVSRPMTWRYHLWGFWCRRSCDFKGVSKYFTMCKHIFWLHRHHLLKTSPPFKCAVYIFRFIFWLLSYTVLYCGGCKNLALLYFWCTNCFFYISSFAVFTILQINCYTLYFSFIPYVDLFNQTLLCILLLCFYIKEKKKSIPGSTIIFSHQFHTRCTSSSFQKVYPIK